MRVVRGSAAGVAPPVEEQAPAAAVPPPPAAPLPAVPPIAAVPYDPATGTYIGPDGARHTQGDLATTGTKTWQSMLEPPGTP